MHFVFFFFVCVWWVGAWRRLKLKDENCILIISISSRDLHGWAPQSNLTMFKTCKRTNIVLPTCWIVLTHLVMALLQTLCMLDCKLFSWVGKKGHHCKAFSGTICGVVCSRLHMASRLHKEDLLVFVLRLKHWHVERRCWDSVI